MSLLLLSVCVALLVGGCGICMRRILFGDWRPAENGTLLHASIGALLLHLIPSPWVRPLLFVIRLVRIDISTVLRTTNADGCTALHCAVHDQPAQGQHEPAEMLLGSLPVGVCVGLVQDTTPQGYTALHIACSTNSSVDTVRYVLACSADANAVDLHGRTALHYAASNGNAGHVQALLDAGAVREISDTKGRTPLYFACQSAKEDAVISLLEAPTGQPGASCASTDHGGYTVLMAAVIGGSAPIVARLLGGLAVAGENALGAGTRTQTRSGSTALSIACELGRDDITALLLDALQEGDDKGELNGEVGLQELLSSDHFGQTALHAAAAAGYATLVERIVTHVGVAAQQVGATSGDATGQQPPPLMRLLGAQDDDGATPIHKLCAAIAGVRPTGRHGAQQSDEPRRLAQALARVLEDCPAAATVLDYGNDHPLHLLCCRPKGDLVALQEAIETILRATASAGKEARALGRPWRTTNSRGMTPLHLLHQSKAAATAQRLLSVLEAAALNAGDGTFLEAFEPLQPPQNDDGSYQRRRGPHNRIALQTRQAVLQGEHNIHGVAAHLKDIIVTRQNPPRIVVLAGAGVSTNCGIRDFRSPETGLYTHAGFRDSFNLECLRTRPVEFYDQMRQVFLPLAEGGVQPSTTHRFFALLQAKGMLTRVYTQNIDGLEAAAGVSSSKLVEAHGSFSQPCRCIGCGAEAAGGNETFWHTVAQPDGVPRCHICGQVMRPGVVFFGEALPACFEENRRADLSQADLLLVLGSSLSVYPFAALLNEVGPLVPRLFINRELRGPFTKLAETGPSNNGTDGNSSKASHAETVAYRDAAYVGDCDRGVQELCEELGWADMLEAMMVTPSTGATGAS